MAATGFDSDFLTVAVGLPTAPASAPTRTLPFTHFTVVLQLDRRLAVVTAANLDGAHVVDLARGDDWHLDPRVPASVQTGPEVYAANDLDRGHLTRRRDPVWGDAATAAQANVDTFTYVNAAPQAALFNQGELLWAGLENYVLQHAQTYAQRLSVFTAPVFGAEDVPYRGIEIPRRFWKIAAWRSAAGDDRDGTLAATGYVLDQSPQLDKIDLSDSSAERVTPPLGAYLTYQVPIADIASLTGVDLGPLPDADRMPAPVPTAASVDLGIGSPDIERRWALLSALSEIHL